MSTEQHRPPSSEGARITVNLNGKSATALDLAVAVERSNKTEVVNRALQVYEWILSERAKGNELAILDAAGSTLHRVMIF